MAASCLVGVEELECEEASCGEVEVLITGRVI